MYQGNGTSWTEISPQASELTWVNTVSASAWNSAPHWILELSDSSKVACTLQTPQPPNGMRVAVYDATTSEFASWAPYSSVDVPNQWGVISSFSTTPIADPKLTPTKTSAPTLTSLPTPTQRATATATPTQTATPSPP